MDTENHPSLVISITSVCIRRGVITIPGRCRSVLTPNTLIATDARGTTHTLTVEANFTISGLRSFFQANTPQPNDAVVLTPTGEEGAYRIHLLTKPRRAPTSAPAAATTRPTAPSQIIEKPRRSHSLSDLIALYALKSGFADNPQDAEAERVAHPQEHHPSHTHSTKASPERLQPEELMIPKVARPSMPPTPPRETAVHLKILPVAPLDAPVPPPPIITDSPQARNASAVTSQQPEPTASPRRSPTAPYDFTAPPRHDEGILSPKRSPTAPYDFTAPPRHGGGPDESPNEDRAEGRAEAASRSSAFFLEDDPEPSDDLAPHEPEWQAAFTPLSSRLVTHLLHPNTPVVVRAEQLALELGESIAAIEEAMSTVNQSPALEVHQLQRGVYRVNRLSVAV
jgi:hypothetical protein